MKRRDGDVLLTKENNTPVTAMGRHLAFFSLYHSQHKQFPAKAEKGPDWTFLQSCLKGDVQTQAWRW